MLKLKDENKEEVSSHHSHQSFTLKLPQLMLELKDEIKQVAPKNNNQIKVFFGKALNDVKAEN